MRLAVSLCCNPVYGRKHFHFEWRTLFTRRPFKNYAVVELHGELNASVYCVCVWWVCLCSFCWLFSVICLFICVMYMFICYMFYCSLFIHSFIILYIHPSEKRPCSSSEISVYVELWNPPKLKCNPTLLTKKAREKRTEGKRKRQR